MGGIVGVGFLLAGAYLLYLAITTSPLDSSPASVTGAGAREGLTLG